VAQSFLRHYSPRSHSLAMLHPIQKTTITRFVNILTIVGRSYLGHNSDEPTAMDPMSIVQSLPHAGTQGGSDHTTPESDPTFEYLYDPGLGPLHPVPPKEVTANRWSAASSLVFPSMNPLVMSAWNEGREVEPSHQRRATADNIFRLDSGPQRDQLESV